MMQLNLARPRHVDGEREALVGCGGDLEFVIGAGMHMQLVAASLVTCKVNGWPTLARQVALLGVTRPPTVVTSNVAPYVAGCDDGDCAAD
jgi:hypothetical protein